MLYFPFTNKELLLKCLNVSNDRFEKVKQFLLGKKKNECFEFSLLLKTNLYQTKLNCSEGWSGPLYLGCFPNSRFQRFIFITGRQSDLVEKDRIFNNKSTDI